jgi:uncharacterized protein (TIRG00374 family)
MTQRTILRSVIGLLLKFLRIALGICILVYLFYRIDRSTKRITLQTQPVSIERGAIYVDPLNPADRYIILDVSKPGAGVQALYTGPRELPDSGALSRASGSGPDQLVWTAREVDPVGLSYAADVFAEALTNWQWLLAGALIYVLAVLGLTARWQMVLYAQGVVVPWNRALSMSLVGFFFNAFMPGSTGGDLAKGFLAARGTVERKAEAFSTVFIDRMLGLPALLLLGGLVVCIRAPFFLAHSATRVAFFFMLAVILCFSAVMVAAFGWNLFERWAFLRRLEERTSLGPLVRRIYEAFFLCRRQPILLIRAFALSLVSQLLVILTAFCYGSSLGITASGWDYLSLFPIILSIAAVPVTPGGLGVREGATVALLGVVGVPAVSALPLSLLLYFSTIIVGLIGGLVFIVHPMRRQMLSAIQAPPQDVAQTQEDPDPSHP